MVEGRGGGASFPVAFYDGEREMSIGEVNISPTLEYKPFQHMLSQKIGISPNQISIYLVDRREIPKSPFQERRRIPITGKVNFATIIYRHKDCGFLVVLKRSRRSRNRRERLANGVIDYGNLSSENEFSPPENVVLLRRDDNCFPMYGQISHVELAELNRRLESVSLHGFGSDRVNPNWDPRKAVPAKELNRKKLYCEECDKSPRNGPTSSFHHCVNDEVVTGFVPRFGPIGRPKRERVNKV